MLEEQVFEMLAGLFLYFGWSQVGWFPPVLSLFTELSLAKHLWQHDIKVISISCYKC